MQFRDLKQQYAVLKDDIDKAVAGVLSSAQFISGGAVRELEAQLAEYVGVKHCITCANGTDALTLALKAWGIGPGDAVFVPDFTFFASAEVVALEGATPVFVDVDDTTFNVDVNSLENAIKMRGGVAETLKVWGIQLEVSASQSVYIPAYKGSASHNYAHETKEKEGENK